MAHNIVVQEDKGTLAKEIVTIAEVTSRLEGVNKKCKLKKAG